MDILEHQESRGSMSTECEELSDKKEALEVLLEGTKRRERRVHKRVKTKIRESVR